MTDREFWKLIGKHVARKGDGSIDARPLAKVLARLTPEEILAFEQHTSKYYFESYTWRLWGAAWLIHEGAPDDTFDYFRSWLLGCGRDIYLAAMEDPDSLAEFATPEAIDDFLYTAASSTYEEVTGKRTPPSRRKLPKLKKDLDFSDGEAMAATYPRLFARFAGDRYAPAASDELLERCRKHLGLKSRKKLTDHDIAALFQQFRPSGDGLQEIYAGVEHGPEIARRLAAAMQVDGTTRGSTLSANNRQPVTGKEAIELVKSYCKNVHELAREMDDPELAERFTASKFVLRAGQRDSYTLNPATNDAIERLRNALFNVFYESVSPAGVLSVAVRRVVGQRILPFYIEWPLCAVRFQTSEPLAPLFQIWQRNVAWRLADGGVVEVFMP
jgi:hypothetical protein